MTPQALERFLGRWVRMEAEYPNDGSRGQRERLAELARELLKANPGRGLVEIGCLTGGTTQLLAGVAKQFGSSVMAIDPWTPGTQNCAGGEYEMFVEAVFPLREYVHVFRMRSDDPRVAEALPAEIALAFVDGLHSYETVRQDVLMVQRAEVVVVDDTSWSDEVRRGMRDALGDMAEGSAKRVVSVGNFRETYLV